MKNDKQLKPQRKRAKPQKMRTGQKIMEFRSHFEGKSNVTSEKGSIIAECFHLKTSCFVIADMCMAWASQASQDSDFTANYGDPRSPTFRVFVDGAQGIPFDITEEIVYDVFDLPSE
jgi:hypothetical protein